MQSQLNPEKLLLMGKEKSGKTSMHSIIFANYPVKEVIGIGYTVGVDRKEYTFLGNLRLNLWDCGGQKDLMKSYFESRKEEIFTNVGVLIYVFDIESKDDILEKEFEAYKNSIENIEKFSPNAKLFILIHKMDKLKENEKELFFDKRKNQIIELSGKVSIRRIFGTSIWDETLYQAWSTIVQYLIPNREFITSSLNQFCQICECDEIVLFERSTFLIITYFSTSEKSDVLKYERLSNIIKQFKLSCKKVKAEINSMTISNSNFTSFIEQFTENTFIMIVFSDQTIMPAAVELNISLMKKFFSKSCKEGKGELDNLFFQYKIKN